MITIRTLLASVTGALALALAAPVLAADRYPNQPIKLIVPYPPGGGIDPTARIFAQALGEELGTTLVVQNVGGASGQIGTEQAAKATPDGYTLLFASVAPNAILPAAKPKLPYGAKDFAPISLIGSAPYVLVAHPSVPGTNVRQLLDSIRTKPDFVASFASSGQLSGPHLAGELFKMLSKAQMTHVPYRGNGPAVMAVLSGEVPITFASAPAVMPHVKDGRLKVFGISANKRSASVPDIPALGEILPGLEVSQWYGLMAPTGTPPAVLEKLSKATAKVLASPGLQSKFAAHGIESRSSASGAEFAKFVAGDVEKYRQVIKSGNIPVD